LLQPVGFGATTMLERHFHNHYHNQTNPKPQPKPETKPKKQTEKTLVHTKTFNNNQREKTFSKVS
jgi:hypothetical protein